MDHSLYGYLSRRSDEELKAILGYCLDHIKEYDYVIKDLLKIMEERENASNKHTSTDFRA